MENRYEIRARELMLTPDARRRYVGIHVGHACPDCGDRFPAAVYESDACSHARTCRGAAETPAIAGRQANAEASAPVATSAPKPRRFGAMAKALVAKDKARREAAKASAPVRAFVCPVCGARRESFLTRQWCDNGHQMAAMREASVVAAVDAVIGKAGR
jgi:hypothetical protein